MSGTSADGVDIAITKIAGRGLDMSAQLVQHHHRPYPTELRKQIFAFRGGEVRDNVLAKLAKMGREISLTYATAVNEALATANMNAKQLAAVAAHGQTLFHDPPDTIQWLDPSLIAAEVGCAVVSDFRRADLAAGGQGAPLVPFADYILFRHPTKSRVLLNIGGIANMTYLKAGGTIHEVIAFDTGPGNCISDYLCRKFDPTGCGYDINGERARRGTANHRLGFAVLTHPYFNRSGPKSTDGPEMIAAFQSAIDTVDSSITVDDQLATAAWITARTIASEVGKLTVDEVFMSGGGTQNLAIREQFEMTTVSWNQISESAAKEALAFALLAAATLDGVPSNVPSVTGARRAVVLGSITPSP